MSIESRSMKYGQALGQWQVEDVLGSGSFGRSMVFAMRKPDTQPAMYCAMKVITLIEERGVRNSLPPFRQAEYAAAEQKVCRQATREVQLMEQLRGKTNIVDYLGHRFMRWQDRHGFGMDLLIRMELLQDLRSQLTQGTIFDGAQIRRIAEDLCQALKLCHNKNIIHRDIKPENIFFNEDGDYKLGDFGIARIMNDTPSHRASTDVGSTPYLAPEQSSGSYDHRVDIYALGLVLYELANRNRLPFATSSYVTEQNIQDRLSGKPFPPPCALENDPGLSLVIMQACSFHPEDRFDSAEAMLRALRVQVKSPAPVSPPPRTDLYSTSAAEEFPPAVSPAKDLYGTSPAEEFPPTVFPPKDPYVTQMSDLDIPSAEDSVIRGELLKPEKPPRKFSPALLLLPLALLILIAGYFLIPHRHSWIDATCMESAYCEDCGETQGQPLGHDYQAATCTDPMICSRCTIRFGNTLPHNWTAGSCTQDSICIDCGASQGPTNLHNWIAATCTAPEICSSCGDTQGTPLDHDWQDATYMAPQHCSRCPATQGRSLGMPLTRCQMLETTNNGSRKEDILTGTWTDRFSNTYYEALRFWVAEFSTFTDTEYIIYDLGGDFSELEVTVAPLKESGANTTIKVLIYADNVLIYDSGWVGRTTHPLSATLDVSGVQQLKVLCTTDSPAHCYSIVEATLFN